MTTIHLYDLDPTGSDLFADSESYLRELSEQELMINQGGSDLIVTTVVSVVSLVVSYIASQAIARGLNDRDHANPCVQQ
jgi:hypothetical protein